MSKPEFFDTPGYGEITRLHYNYSQAVRIGGRVEISGQGGWDTNFTLPGAPLPDEIATAFDNVERTLAEAGATWRDVVTIDTYHVPTADDSIGEEHLSAITEQFRKRLGDHRPVWTALGVKALGLPGMHIEIRVTAVISQ